MKKPTVLIFGHSGGIGSATKQAFISSGYRIIPVNKDIIDFESDSADVEIQSLLTNANPDVVVNCAGIFENGWDANYLKTIKINFGSNWSILRHYIKYDSQHKARIIMIGSSSYNKGRQLYPLYSASKSALYNLWESARDSLANSLVQVDLLNPVRTLTRMSTAGKTINPDLDYLSPEQVADEIIKLVKENLPSRCINMTFEDTK